MLVAAVAAVVAVEVAVVAKMVMAREIVPIFHLVLLSPLWLAPLLTDPLLLAPPSSSHVSSPSSPFCPLDLDA